MIRRRTGWLVCLPLLLGSLGAVVACGSDGESTPTRLSGPAADGEGVYRTNGCGACHGTAYQGGTGPTLIGLAGSTVKLNDGTTVTADAAYLTRAISDPQSQQVDGFKVKMPANSLSAEKVAQLVALIEALKG